MRLLPKTQPGACDLLSSHGTGYGSGPSAESHVALAHCLPGNRILADLRAKELHALRDDTDQVWLDTGEILSDGGAGGSRCYFPVAAVISVLTTLADGRTVGVGFVGREGMIGLRSLLGFRTGLCIAQVQVPGLCLRLSTETLRDCFRRAEYLRDRFLQYFALVYNDACQSIACNRAHLLSQRLCRWLLELHDRAGCDELTITHESLSQLLGASRADTSRAAGKLREMNFLRLSHGRITILDRSGIEAAACECYGAAQREDLPARQGSTDRVAGHSGSGQSHAAVHA